MRIAGINCNRQNIGLKQQQYKKQESQQPSFKRIVVVDNDNSEVELLPTLIYRTEGLGGETRLYTGQAKWADYFTLPYDILTIEKMLESPKIYKVRGDFYLY
ncbi:hypothetical protein IJI31_00400 [bacterium]|nr:hypothetical protein [bacterium]